MGTMFSPLIALTIAFPSPIVHHLSPLRLRQGSSNGFLGPQRLSRTSTAFSDLNGSLGDYIFLEILSTALSELKKYSLNIVSTALSQWVVHIRHDRHTLFSHVGKEHFLDVLPRVAHSLVSRRPLAHQLF